MYHSPLSSSPSDTRDIVMLLIKSSIVYLLTLNNCISLFVWPPIPVRSQCTLQSSLGVVFPLEVLSLLLLGSSSLFVLYPCQDLPLVFCFPLFYLLYQSFWSKCVFLSFLSGHILFILAWFFHRSSLILESTATSVVWLFVSIFLYCWETYCFEYWKLSLLRLCRSSTTLCLVFLVVINQIKCGVLVCQGVWFIEIPS